jgi:hypothetical protein
MGKNKRRQRHEQRRRFRVLGEDTLLDYGMWPYPDVLFWGNHCIRLDAEKLPRRLALLIPVGYATTKVRPIDWEPFVTLACAMGRL